MWEGWVIKEGVQVGGIGLWEVVGEMREMKEREDKPSSCGRWRWRWERRSEGRILFGLSVPAFAPGSQKWRR